MSDRCKKCGCLNFRVKMGLDTCGHCDEPVKRVVDKSPKKQKSLPKPVETVNHPRAYLIGCGENDLFEIGGKDYTGKQILSALNAVLGVCKKCGESRAKGSNSYCREHERERLKKWRQNR